MSKRTEIKGIDLTSQVSKFNYEDPSIVLGRDVIVGLNGGTNLQGEVRFIDGETIVIVSEPKSKLDIETRVVHTLVNIHRVDFIQFKTDRE